MFPILKSRIHQGIGPWNSRRGETPINSGGNLFWQRVQPVRELPGVCRGLSDPGPDSGGKLKIDLGKCLFVLIARKLSQNYIQYAGSSSFSPEKGRLNFRDGY